MSQEKDILKSSIVQGFGTLIVREFFIKILAFLGQIFLARLLAPSDFGVYVIIVFIINLFSLFSDIGLNLAIIQKKEEPTHDELSSVFFVQILLSLGLIILIWIFSPSIKLFYPTFINANVFMLRVFSITLLLTSFRSIPISLLERKIKYNLISLLDIMGVLVYYVVSILGAFLGFGVWSFILGAVIKEIVETVVLYTIKPFVPQLKISIKNLKNMVKFGKYIQGNGLVGFLGTSITPVLGGRLIGPYAVGILDFAFNIASLPTTIGINFGRVAFAGYSRMQEQNKLLLNSINHSMSMLSIILYIFPVIIFSFSNQLVPLIFSAKWIPSIPALYWYSAVTFFIPIVSPFGQGIFAIGKSKEIFWGTFITTFFGWIGAYFLIHLLGLLGIAIIYFLTVLSLCLFYIMIFKKNGFNFPILSILGPKLIAVFIITLFSLIMNIILPQGIYILFFKLFISFMFYFILMFILAKQDTVELFRLIMSLIKLKHI